MRPSPCAFVSYDHRNEMYSCVSRRYGCGTFGERLVLLALVLVRSLKNIQTWIERERNPNRITMNHETIPTPFKA